jgi:hypothetical protein
VADDHLSDFGQDGVVFILKLTGLFFDVHVWPNDVLSMRIYNFMCVPYSISGPTPLKIDIAEQSNRNLTNF